MFLPFTYLGIQVGRNSRNLRMWDTMIHKIKMRLLHRKGIYLSFIGRVSMIKSIITTLPFFFLSFFKVPKLMLKEIRKI